MANIYLKRDRDFLVLCDENGEIFDNQFTTDVKISASPGSFPMVTITFLLPKDEDHICSKFMKIKTHNDCV